MSSVLVKKSLILILVSLLLSFPAFAAKKKPKKIKINYKIAEEISSKFDSKESSLKSIIQQRSDNASAIIDQKVKATLDEFEKKAKEQNIALISEWNAERSAFATSMNDLITLQALSAEQSMLQLNNTAATTLAGATMASINYLQTNYGRDAIRRTTPRHLQHMAMLIRTGNVNIDATLQGFLSSELSMQNLSTSMQSYEENIAANVDANSLFIQLTMLQMQSDFSSFDANIENGKISAFQQLLSTLVSFANLSSSNQTLQNLIKSSEDNKYPTGALSFLRGTILESGTAWLRYAPEIFESTILSTSTVSKLPYDLSQSIIQEILRSKTQSSFDQIHLVRLNVNTAIRLIPILKNALQVSKNERESIAAMLEATAMLIKNSPNSGTTRLQRLRNDLTQVRAQKSQAAESAQLILSALQEGIAPKQLAAEKNLNTLLTIRNKYGIANEAIPINFEMINDLKFFLEDKETIIQAVKPAYWGETTQLDINMKGVSKTTKNNFSICLGMLADEELIENTESRNQEISLCLKSLIKKAKFKKKSDEKKFLTFTDTTLNTISLDKFIVDFEKSFFGEDLVTYAQNLNLNSVPTVNLEEINENFDE